jgi:glycine/D-amino acid oxidase-like deaminating enzyme
VLFQPNSQPASKQAFCSTSLLSALVRLTLLVWIFVFLLLTRAHSLVHPLSPSGKLVHWGMPGLDATRRLVDVACRAAEKHHHQQQQQQHHASHHNALPVVLRHEILRLALTPQHVNQLLATERAFASNTTTIDDDNEDDDDDLGSVGSNTNRFSCHWLDALEIAQRYNLSSSTTTTTQPDTTTTDNDDDDDDESSAVDTSKKIRGGLLLSGGGCQVLHVPSYLQALWLACLDLGRQGGVEVEWKQPMVVEEKNAAAGAGAAADTRASSCSCWSRRLREYDTIVLAAGSGMFGDLISLPCDRNDQDADDESALPVHLVRGQSIEMDLPPSTTATTSGDPFCPENSDQQQERPALLCGKYVSPLPPTSCSPNAGHTARILIGATHEFQAEPMSPDQVVSFLKDATAPMVPSTLWQQHGDSNDDDDDDGGRLKITSEFRVQSQRGKHGRMPIIGRYRLFQEAATEQDDIENVDPVGLAATPTRCQNNKDSASWCPRPDQNVWIFTGLSSRGLLYHALYGDLLTDAILADSEQVLWTRSPDLKWWQKKQKKK